MSIITTVASFLSGIGIIDFILLAIAIAPLTILNTAIQTNKHELSGSVMFNQYLELFRLLSLVFTGILVFGLIQYGIANGVGVTIIYLLIGFIIQSWLYAFIKMFIPGEIFLIPLEIAGLILFYTIVL